MMGRLASSRRPKFIDLAGDERMEGGNVLLPGEGEVPIPLECFAAVERHRFFAN